MERVQDLTEIVQPVTHTSEASVPVLVLADSLLVLHHSSVGIIRSLGRTISTEVKTT
ncbi:MAG: hypothetical protein JWO48_3047 [Bryobacterales bacterium]|nr:hypothetical protein [Bryobacterales bacterium]